MADKQQYSKPPLIEAVLELRFDQGLSDRELTRVKDRLQRSFPAVDELRNFEAKLEPHGAVKELGLAGYRMTAKSGTDIVTVQQNAVATSRLAPYEGWEQLIEKARENCEIFEKVVGFRRVARLGARFVNRIDVPDRVLANTHVTDLLNIKIALPVGTASSLGAFSLAINFVHSSSGLKILAQVAVGEPALIDHTSIFLDLDCAIDEEIPANMEQLWKLVATMRDPKDDIFESLLTPQVRELFR